MASKFQFRKKFSLSILVALALMLIVVPIALADNIVNDVTIGGNDTLYVITSTTVDFWIVANNGDGQNGCNASDGSPATVTINTPEQVTATPDMLVFDECQVPQSVVFTATEIGVYPITVDVSDTGDGTYNTTPAKFDLNVIPLPFDLYLPTIFR